MTTEKWTPKIFRFFFFLFPNWEERNSKEAMDKKTEKEAEEKEETERQIKQRRKGKNKTKENGGRGFGLQTSDGDEPIFESENCVQLSPLVADGFFSSSSSSLFVSCVSLFFFSFVFFLYFYLRRLPSTGKKPGLGNDSINISKW